MMNSTKLRMDRQENDTHKLNLRVISLESDLQRLKDDFKDQTEKQNRLFSDFYDRLLPLLNIRLEYRDSRVLVKEK